MTVRFHRRFPLVLWGAFALPAACSGGCNDSHEAARANAPTDEPSASSGEAAAPLRLEDEPVRPLEPPDGADGTASAVDPNDPVPVEGEPLTVTPPRSDWQGPYFTVTQSSAGIYSEPKLERALKIGYARNGGRVPVLPETLPSDTCRAGWYQLVEGGFICGHYGTTDSSEPAARLSTTPPDLDAILPYPYARNGRNGTPLYSSVPSDDQIVRYEPYLARRTAPEDGPGSGVDIQDRPWWLHDQPKLSEVRLDELSAESDGILAKRMVRGFYIAIDREFEWNKRKWFRTTKGLVAPKDRFAETKPSEFQGVALDGDVRLPIAWVYGQSKKERPLYKIDIEKAKRSQAGSVPRLEAIPLSGESTTLDKQTYLQTTEGLWVDAAHVRVAEPRELPQNLEANERWIDVDLSSQTLVAYVGSRPVYTTLISSGREADDPKKDHRTPTGEWRIREKHITTTMDGDGTAAGDLPYSIEDVPYAMYYEGSYALHTAFWHQNYGVPMSHGCVNLSPRDARYLFFFTTPHTRTGWHGAWPSQKELGSRIVVHD